MKRPANYVSDINICYGFSLPSPALTITQLVSGNIYRKSKHISDDGMSTVVSPSLSIATYLQKCASLLPDIF